MTNKEKAKELQKKLAQHGIYALYGGSKGHGFWMYRTTRADAIAQYENWQPGRTDYAGKVIKNTGDRSGNECFWMYADAATLCAALDLMPPTDECRI